MHTAPWLQRCLPKKSRRSNFTVQHSFPKGEELGWAIVRAPQIRVTLAYLAACTDIKCRWSTTRALSFVYNTKECARALPFTSFPLRQHLVFLIACLVSACWPIISFLGSSCPFSLVPSPTWGGFIVHAGHGVLQNIRTTQADVLMPELCEFIVLHLSTRILINDDWVPMKRFHSKDNRLTNVHQRFKNSTIWWWLWNGTTLNTENINHTVTPSNKSKFKEWSYQLCIMTVGDWGKHLMSTLGRGASFSGQQDIEGCRYSIFALQQYVAHPPENG